MFQGLTDLFGDLTGHFFSKVPVLTDSVEQLATLHHLHNDEEPRSRAGLMRELDTVGVNLQDLHYVWVVGTHHMETHLIPGLGAINEDLQGQAFLR